MTFFLFIIIFVALGVFLVLMKSKKETQQHESHELNDKGKPYPPKLLDLNTTTIADRQRAYHRGYQTQLRYDILQRRAELAGDTATLEAIRTNTYKGPLPELDSQRPTHFDLLDDNGDPITEVAEPVIQKLQYFCVKDKGYHVSVWPKDQGMQNLDYIEFDIAGMSYRENIDEYLGEHVGTLEAEPTNLYDVNAIKILAEDGHHVGYVPKNMTDEVRKHSKLPCRCYFYIGENDGTYYSDCYIKIQL